MNFEGKSLAITLTMPLPSTPPLHLLFTKSYLLVELFNELSLNYFY